MNGVRQREVSGSEHREHVMEGRSMCAILMPDAAPQRRCMTPRTDTFAKTSQLIGSSQALAVQEA